MLGNIWKSNTKRVGWLRGCQNIARIATGICWNISNTIGKTIGNISQTIGNAIGNTMTIFTDFSDFLGRYYYFHAVIRMTTWKNITNQVINLHAIKY